MNTYTIRADYSCVKLFSVEAANEDAAIDSIEWNDEEPYSTEEERLENHEVIEVEYGHTDLVADVEFRISVDGITLEDNAKEIMAVLDSIVDQSVGECHRESDYTVSVNGMKVIDIKEA